MAFESNLFQTKAENPTEIPLSALRILLWDIDGTIVRSRVNGAFKDYFVPTMKKVFGSVGNFEKMQFSGMTDTQIIYESLCEEGFTPERIFEKKEELLKVFQAEMSAIFERNFEQHEVLAGVRAILAATAENPLFYNSLLTGNLSVAAEIKLKSVDLWHYFSDSPNAFGEISHNRNDLATEAGKLFNDRFDFEFSPSQFIVIGDTPNDIICARHFGAKAVAVGTGRGQFKEKLLAEKPDIFLDDLSNTNEVLKILSAL